MVPHPRHPQGIERPLRLLKIEQGMYLQHFRIRIVQDPLTLCKEAVHS
jgi:hypothetical protein